MKKIVTTLMIAGLALSFASCQKELDNAATTGPGEVVVLTLNATHEVGTKTVLEGTTPKWAAGDKVTVMYKKTGESTWSSSISGEASSADSYVTATFSTSLTSPDGSKDAYAIYPANNLSQDVADKAKITIASTQHPTGTSFDGGSDILISKPFNPTTSPVTTQFARLGAVLKISIDNATLASEKLVSLSVVGANPLAGDVLVGLSDKEVKGIENGSNTVMAEYAPANQFTVGSSNYVYLVVKPQTLANGSHLIINGQTENYTFTKDIELSQDIYLNSGHIVPLRISITTDPVLKDKVFFEERFAESTGTMGWSGSAGNGTFNTENTWTTNNAYGAGGSAKFGTGSKLGTATTPEISISPAIYKSQAIKLSFQAGAWNGGSESTTLKLTATNCNLKSSGTTVTSVDMVKGEWTEYILDVTDIEGDITIAFKGNEASNSRFLLDDVCIYYGTKPIEKPSPELAFSSTTAQAYLGETASFTEPTLTNEHGVAVTYESDNTDIAEVASDGQVTLKADGTAHISAVFAGNASYKAQTVSYELTVHTPTLSIAPAGDILMGGSANSVCSITITATHAWTATLNAAATSARGTSFSVLNSSDSVIDGAITGTTGKTTIKFKALGDGDPSDVSSYGTITITDNLYDGATSGAIEIKQSANSGDPVYTKVTSLTSGKTYILVQTYDDTPYIVDPRTVSGKSFAPVDATDLITAGQIASNTTTNAYAVTITSSESQYTVVNSESKYIGIGDNVSVNDSKTLVYIHINAGQISIQTTSTKDGGRGIVYRSGYNFRSYAMSNAGKSGYGSGYFDLYELSE